VPLGCRAHDALQPVWRGRRRLRDGKQRCRRACRIQTHGTPMMRSRGIPVHENELSLLIYARCNLGARRQGQDEPGPRDRNCNGDAVLLHRPRRSKQSTTGPWEGRAPHFRICCRTKKQHPRAETTSPGNGGFPGVSFWREWNYSEPSISG
jgi:hypothetical protein